LLASTSGNFLDGLDLARCDAFNAWRVAVADDAHRWNCAVWAELSMRDLPAERLLPFARAWVECAPADPDAQANLVRLLHIAGRSDADGEAPSGVAPHPPAPEQDIRFCQSRDGTTLAYAELGTGPPVVKAANWHTNLEQDFDSPAWPHWISLFAADHRFLRYDERGNGLSDWDCAITHDGFVEDLECVVDAAGVDRFDLLGISHGASVAIRYAVKHPERVRRMILWGSYAAGWAVSAKTEDREQRELIWSLTKAGWALDDPALRTLFTATFLPDASPDQVEWFNEFQRTNSSLENTLVIQQLLPTIDVREHVGKVTTPTLVGHSTRDAVVPFVEARALAAQLPGARFIAIDSANHLLLEREPGWAKFAAAVRDFLN
jgi:pimeloyl-ACP methyl ester carboxylesterase